jgi:glycosyltransferase involved in cell wall biosynthesis
LEWLVSLQENKPLISIGLPVYNGEHFIRQALDSLLAQDYQNLEIIISDNFSTDATVPICREYAASDNRINIHQQSRNEGVWTNFKFVLNEAQGEYFMWAAADDYWFPGFISTLYDDLKSEDEAAVALSSIKRIWEDKTDRDIIGFLGSDDPNNKSHLATALAILTPLKYNFYMCGLFRTDILKRAVPLATYGAPAAERCFLIQIALAYRFRYIDKTLYVRLVHSKPFEDRYPKDDPFGTIKKHSKQKYFDFSLLPILYRNIAHSSIIPWQRKLYMPLIMSRLIYRQVFKSRPLRRYRELKQVLLSRLSDSCPQNIKIIIKRIIQKG